MPRNESRDPAYLWDMLDAASAISTFVAGRTFHDFQTDRMLRNAVERNMEIIGEAANRVSENFQKAHPEIPWRNIVGQRNILIHEYGEVKNERIWGFASVIARLNWAIQLLLYSNQTAKWSVMARLANNVKKRDLTPYLSAYLSDPVSFRCFMYTAQLAFATFILIYINNVRAVY